MGSRKPNKAAGPQLKAPRMVGSGGIRTAKPKPVPYKHKKRKKQPVTTWGKGDWRKGKKEKYTMPRAEDAEAGARGSPSRSVLSPSSHSAHPQSTIGRGADTGDSRIHAAPMSDLLVLHMPKAKGNHGSSNYSQGKARRRVVAQTPYNIDFWTH
jgi:hypothetical protein